MTILSGVDNWIQPSEKNKEKELRQKHNDIRHNIRNIYVIVMILLLSICGSIEQNVLNIISCSHLGWYGMVVYGLMEPVGMTGVMVLWWSGIVCVALTHCVVGCVNGHFDWWKLEWQTVISCQKLRQNELHANMQHCHMAQPVERRSDQLDGVGNVVDVGAMLSMCCCGRRSCQLESGELEWKWWGVGGFLEQKCHWVLAMSTSNTHTLHKSVLTS